jgi:drug/metabolite transporter (DMT)-like permease
VSVLFAAFSALAFGVGDFLGGMSARRMAAVLSAVTAQATGLVLLLVLAAAVGGWPTATEWAWSSGAGASGALALLLFYWALAEGQMSVVAPLSAVMSALIPLAAGLVDGERPGPVAWAGVAAALVAIALISREPGDPVAPDELSHPPRPGRGGTVVAASLLAGVGFGMFLVGISRTAEASGMWPLVGARATATVVVGIGALAVRAGRPRGEGVRWALLAGVFDVAANGLYLVASRRGLLTLVGVVVAMYPAATVLLARVVLRERLASHQLAGLALAAAAVAAVTAA